MTLRGAATATYAKFILNGGASNAATWIDSLRLSQNDVEIEDADTSDWKLVLKKCDGGSPSITLSSGSELTITQNTTFTLIEIEADLSSLCEGDYFIDLAQKTPDNIVIHWGHGVFLVKDENLGF